MYGSLKHVTFWKAGNSNNRSARNVFQDRWKPSKENRIEAEKPICPLINDLWKTPVSQKQRQKEK